MTDTKPPAPIPAAVSVVNIQMPFGSMVVFMVKWALAAIPAILILSFVGGVVAAAFYGITSGYERSAQTREEAPASLNTITFRENVGSGTTATNDSASERRDCSAQLSDGATVRLPALLAHQPILVPMVSSEPKKVQCGETVFRIYWLQSRR